MKVTCESCHTGYELSAGKEGLMGCPICEHVNRVEFSIQKPAPEPSMATAFDPNKTMIGPMDADFGGETTSVKKVTAGKKAALPADRLVYLSILDGDQRGQRILLTKSDMTIGRNQTDIILNDSEVSRRHCSLQIFEDLVVVRDLGSANGTSVNERMIQEKTLKDGDVLQIGTTVMKLSIQPKP